MFIKIVVVGKTKEASLKSLERSYLERISRYTRVDLVAVRPERVPQDQKASPALRAEAERILRKIGEGDFCIVLDNGGRELTSPELTHFLKWHLISGTRRMVFGTGGPLGRDVVVKKRADLLLSFSKLTFTHQMIRALFREQLYRAWTLIRGEKYHK